MPSQHGEKRQIIHRLPIHFVRKILSDFNSGAVDAPHACQLLSAGKTRLYQLRSLWLKDRQNFSLEVSGGNMRGHWPAAAIEFLREFIPLQDPPNYQLAADELLRLHNLRRVRSSSLSDFSKPVGLKKSEVKGKGNDGSTIHQY